MKFHFPLPSCWEVPIGETACFDLREGGHWFGHGFNHTQPYPLDVGEISNSAFAVNNIQSPIWLCSKGWGLLVENTAPLDVRINESGSGELRVSCPGEPLRLRAFQGKNLPEARAALLAHIGQSKPSPAADLLGNSFFCTWTQYPRCITQSRVLDMARQIRAQDYPSTTLIIDDRWERCFGELTFSSDFPNPKEMMHDLHALGFQVWLWVTPFINQEAAEFEVLAASGVLVRERSGPGAALFKWWGGTAGLVDLTGKIGREWYRDKLLALRHLGVDGFKIDGGDHKYQPGADACWADFRGASGYSDALLAVFEEIAPGSCETRTAWLSQSRAILWRQGGKDSHWGRDNGLKALVALGLHLSVLGYDMHIPDMVPGRVQTMSADDPLPTDELMVRWTEVSAFFPFLQFSYFPWNYCRQTAAAVRGFARVHKTLQAYLEKSSQDRSLPIFRPLWFDSPDDERLYTVSDEFLLGRDLLVAPVLDSEATSRDVTLPTGDWLDAWDGKKVQSGGVLKKYPAPCPGIPLFVRQQNTELAAALRRELGEIERGSILPGITTATHQCGLNRDLSVTG